MRLLVLRKIRIPNIWHMQFFDTFLSLLRFALFNFWAIYFINVIFWTKSALAWNALKNHSNEIHIRWGPTVYGFCRYQICFTRRNLVKTHLGDGKGCQRHLQRLVTLRQNVFQVFTALSWGYGACIDHAMDITVWLRTAFARPTVK